ncbi:MAG TPA: hypothetical protein VKE94_21715 [Gemmataceae bacterium]|nr:hypothetical protein [Gemmataceae bacterium]
MKRLCSVLAMLALAATLSAQEAAPKSSAPTNALPITAMTDGAIPVESDRNLFANGGLEASAGGGSGPRGFSNFIGFLGNPLQNIDPRAITEIYPIFGSAWTSEAGPLPHSNFQLYGAGLTVALSDRFAAGLNQGGFADVHLSKKDFDQLSRLFPDPRFRDVEMGGNRSGWLNLGGFFQYTLIADVENQLLFTAGLRWEAPCGSHEIFQGHGPAHLAPYITYGKECGHFHVLGTVGYEFPAGPGSDTTNLFYANVHLDRQCFGWFYPLVEVNWTYHVTSVSPDQVVRRGFFDFDNFEGSGNIVVLAVGANAVLVRDKLELGGVYSTSLATQRDFNLNGLLVRVTLKF